MSNFASSKPVILKRVRLDFFDIFTPGKPLEEDGKWKYKLKAIMEADSEALKAAKESMGEAARALWGENAKNVVPNITANSKAVRDGNSNMDTSGNVRPEYAGKFFISASNDSKPQVVAPKKHNGKFVTITENGRGFVDGLDVTDTLGFPITVPYRGCYVNVKVTFVAGKSLKTASGKTLPNQIYAKLEAIQFVADGDAFGAGPTNADGFEEEEVETSRATPADDGLF